MSNATEKNALRGLLRDLLATREVITTREAADLLGISCQRANGLLKSLRNAGEAYDGGSAIWASSRARRDAWSNRIARG